jgi:hypothetical protein
MRQNKWFAARHGIDADLIVDELGSLEPARVGIGWGRAGHSSASISVNMEIMLLVWLQAGGIDGDDQNISGQAEISDTGDRRGVE